MEARVLELINDYEQGANPHQQYLLKLSAEETIATQADVESAIDH